MRALFPLLLSSIFVLSGCNEEVVKIQKQHVRPVKLTTVLSNQNPEIREFPGTVAAAKVSELSFRINGELNERPVLSGERVTKGQLIARLDDNDLQQDLKNSKADYEFAEAEYQRINSIYEQKLVSRSAYDQARTRKVEAESRLDKARNNLSYSVIRAPFDGVVSNVLVDNFQSVTAKQSIVTLQGEDMIEIVIQMPEKIVANVRKDAGQSSYRPEVTFASITDKSFPATYKEYSAQANPGSQTYDVTFMMERPEDLLILPGMTATVQMNLSKILREEKRNHLLVDPQAVVTADGSIGSFVWRYDVDSGKVNKVNVTLGNVIDGGIQIIDGLQAGDQVVLAGMHLLTDGQTVKPLKKERGL